MGKQNINVRILKAVGKGGLAATKAAYIVGKAGGKAVKNNPIKIILGGSTAAYLNSDMMEYPDKQRAKMMLENHKKGI